MNIPSHIRLIIFDVDGTLVSTKSGATFRKTADDWQWLSGRIEKLQELHGRGVKLGLATNQGGVGMDYSELKGQDTEIICELVRMAKETGCFPDPHSIQVCFTHPNANYQPDLYRVKNDRMRKPNPGMIMQIQEFFKIGPIHTLYVGDRPEDEQAAHNAGVAFQWSDQFFQ